MLQLVACYCLLALASFTETSIGASKENELLVMTVATEANDGFYRFNRSATLHGLNVEVLGMGKKWEGGDIANYAGGGQKINFLRDALEAYKDRPDLVIMFVDSYDLVITAGADDILATFKKLDAKVVFSAEGFCWPDTSLQDQYPVVKMNEQRYLNSGGFIGYAPELYKIASSSSVKDDDDDQLFYTKIFLDEKTRRDFSIRLDTRGELFQNLNGALDDVQIKFKGATSYLYNSRSGSTPLVVHGNGPIKVSFNGLTNYLVNQWTPTSGCLSCKEGTISLDGVKAEDFPRVMMALYIEQPTAFLDEFFEHIAQLDYPKEKITLYIHYADSFHDAQVKSFIAAHGHEYSSVQLHSPETELNNWTARNKALEEYLKTDCAYYFAVDGDVQLENAKTLQLLIERNRSVIAPMVLRPNKMWSNFWGALSNNGFYKRSDDYHDIILGKRRGIWNIPYLTNVYLIHGHRIRSLLGGHIDGDADADMAMTKRLRDLGIFMYVDNQQYYGFLVNSEDYETTHRHNDMYSIFDNPYAWEKKYIHALYRETLQSDAMFEEPCTDVFWMPVASPTFCRHLIEEMENFGQWSGGKNQDGRLQGGYENVPTVDIHTNQIDWERHWLHFLREYIAPISSKAYPGYFTESRASMNFCVRYKPGEQDRLRPHSDSSTYTINIALNTPGEEYEGGGTRFLRYGCNVTKSRLGWVLMHPGRLTHHHEGLPTVKGTRYIMVSFIDP